MSTAAGKKGAEASRARVTQDVCVWGGGNSQEDGRRCQGEKQGIRKLGGKERSEDQNQSRDTMIEQCLIGLYYLKND
jgi:hypothetical protein